MKKLARILAAILLVAVVLITAVACEKKDGQGRYILAAPVVTISGNTASWKSVKRTTKYGVVVNNEDEIVVITNTFVRIGDEAFAIKVRAIGDDETTISSAYSAVVNSVAIERRNFPTGLVGTEQTSGAYKLTWDVVEAASQGYTVKLKFNNKTIASMTAETNEILISSDQFESAGAYQIEVITRGDGAKIHDSIPSAAVIFTKVVTLANPAQVTLSTGGVIKFAKIDNANKYYVRIMNAANDVVAEEIGNPTIGSTEVTFDIKKFTVTAPGKYYYQVKASRDVTSSYYNDSAWVDAKHKDADTTRAELTLLAAPSNYKLDPDGKTIKWDAVDGAEKYTIKMISGSKTYIAETDKVEYDLSTNSDLTNNSIGGKTVEVTVYVRENIEKGFLAGNPTVNIIDYNYVKKPTIIKDTNIYGIGTLAELNYIATEPNADYRLTANINVEKGNIYGFTTEFGGTFDGNSFSINNFNLVARKGETQLSLFGNVKAGAVIKDLVLLQNEIKVKSETVKGGALIATSNSGTIEGITAAAIIEIEGEVGGIVINNSGTIKNCNIDIDVTGYNKVGGIVAVNTGTITDCKIYTAVITALSTFVDCHSGAVAAISSGKIINTGAHNSKVYATAQGDGTVAYLGAFVGKVTGGEITQCYTANTGDLKSRHTGKSTSTTTASSYAGAFIGYADDVVIDMVYNNGGNLLSTDYAGGFIAHLGSGAILKNGYSYIAKVEGAKAAGLVYTNNGTIENFHYARFALDKDMKITSTVAAGGTLAGLTNITDRAAMKSIETLKKIGFRFTTEVNSEFMIFDKIAYMGKAYEFNKGNIKYTETRTEFAKVYFGDKVISEPTAKVDSNNKGYRADVYTGEGYRITRIMYVS